MASSYYSLKHLMAGLAYIVVQLTALVAGLAGMILDSGMVVLQKLSKHH
jgi:hypothetical protein